MFSIPVVLFFVLLLMPTPYGMKDVGTEYRVGPKVVVEHITQELFNTSSSDVQQWQLLTARIMEKNMNMGALTRDRYLKRDMKWCQKNKIKAEKKNFDKAHAYIENRATDEGYLAAPARHRAAPVT